VELVHAGRSRPGGELVLVEDHHVRGGELSQLQPSEMGLDVYPNGYLVSVEGALPDGAGEPPEPRVQVLPDAHVLVVEHYALVAIRKRVGQLFCNFLALLAVDRLALRSGGRLYSVAGHVEAALLVAGDRALAVTASTHRLLLSSALPDPLPGLQPSAERCEAVQPGARSRTC
jgi:hypothetical protein